MGIGDKCLCGAEKALSVGAKGDRDVCQGRTAIYSFD